jgi:DNA primase
LGVVPIHQPAGLAHVVVPAHAGEPFQHIHHPCLGLSGSQAYSAPGGQLTMSAHAAELLKQQISLLDYLVSQDWKPTRRIARGRLMGLCPLHADRHPSFLVDPAKSLFYCYGCGRGGDVIRFVELSHGVPFGQALALRRRWSGYDSLLNDVARFYQFQLHRHPEAAAYLVQRDLHRPEVAEQMRIGDAPGRCLRATLMRMGYTLDELRQAGVVTREGFDAMAHRIVFPLETNLYGRSLGHAQRRLSNTALSTGLKSAGISRTLSANVHAGVPAPHRFLPGSKGGLYGWQQVHHCRELILVEGLFDWASLWQAGLRNAACSLGTSLNGTQFRQLCDGASRTVYLAFDSDVNGSGWRAAHQLAQRLAVHRVEAFPVELPDGHDPNSFFVHGGGDAHQFQTLLERSRS